MRHITKILILSVLFYSLVIVGTVVLGGLWWIVSTMFLLGLAYDISSYVRLRQGKPILTIYNVRNWFNKNDVERDNENNCSYCGEKCWEGEMCDEQQAGGFN